MEEENRISFHNDTTEYSLSEVKKSTLQMMELDFIGYVMKPVDYDPNKNIPVYFMFTEALKDSFRKSIPSRNAVLANNGYFVFFTNP